MGKIANKAKKLRLSAAKFLKIVPERQKKIENAGAGDVKPLRDYKPNALAAELHPQVQYVKITDVRQLAPDVKLIRLSPDKDKNCFRLAPFAPGQCVSVEVVIEGVSHERPYSVSSSPLEGYYEIIVKREPEGLVSGFIHDNWSVGTEARVSGPFGEFSYNPLRDARHVIGVAGGIGITPMRSMIKAIRDGFSDHTLTLLYGVRTEEDIVLRDELDEAAGTPGISVVYVLSGDRSRSDLPGTAESPDRKDGFERGFIDAELIRKYAPENEPYSVFAAGPDAMYRFLDGELPKLSLRKKFIRFDFRGEPADPEKYSEYQAAREEQGCAQNPGIFRITVRQGGNIFAAECPHNVTIMKALEYAGMIIPSRCRSGECGYCHTRVISGKYFTAPDRDGRRKADTIYNYVHPCVTFPLSDMEIELGGGTRGSGK